MIALPAGAARGISRLTVGPDGQLYVANLNTVVRIDAMGRTSNVITVPGLLQNTITGLVFDNDGALIMASIVPDVYRLAPGATAATRFYSVASINPGDFFHEALVLGPDGLIYGSSFPNNPMMGLIYRLDTMNTPRRVLGLTEMQRDVPAVRFAGVHGMAFGVDGSLYFVNQNTSGNTGEAVGQLLVRRPSGRVELIAGGFNFDWPDGFDGDLVIAQITMANVSAPVRTGGTAQAVFDVPSTPGTYEIRALITDPRGGAIREARVPVTVR
jgi:hypothetical protein